MFLAIAQATILSTQTVWSITVPGDQIWFPRSFYAVASRDVGGTPNRQYTLTITDGTNTVAAVGAADNGTEPGTCDVTWCNTPAATVASGSIGVSVAPLGPFQLRPGYEIIGEIINNAPADQWDSAICWYDFVYTAGRVLN